MRARSLQYETFPGGTADHSDSGYRSKQLSGHTPCNRIYSPTPLTYYPASPLGGFTPGGRLDRWWKKHDLDCSSDSLSQAPGSMGAPLVRIIPVIAGAVTIGAVPRTPVASGCLQPPANKKAPRHQVTESSLARLSGHTPQALDFAYCTPSFLRQPGYRASASCGKDSKARANSLCSLANSIGSLPDFQHS